MDQYFFKTPFATAGDIASIPRDLQPSGDMSYEEGFTSDYSLPNSDPSAKKVPRDQSNQLYKAITENINQYQTYGTPEWITAADNDAVAYSYSAGARVKYDGAVWVSLVDSNDSEPSTDATKWRLASTIETRGGSFGSIVSVAVTPYTVLVTNFGYQHILSGSASALTMPAIAGSSIGDSFNFFNTLSSACIISRDGSSTFQGANTKNVTTTQVTVPAYGACIITKSSSGTWSVVIVGDIGDLYDTAIFRHLESSGTDGGGISSGSWVTRPLNDTQYNGISGASIGSNQITLPAGSYLVDIDSTLYKCSNNKTRLQNITDGSTAIVGMVCFNGAGENQSNQPSLTGIITITSSKVFEVQHRVSLTRNTDGLGVAAGFSTDEIYCVVRIKKIK